MDKILVCSYDERLLPTKGTSGSVCWDLMCAEDITVQPGEVLKVGAGIKTYMPLGRGSKVYARSSLPTKAHLMLANATAIFDADFRGEYILQLYNYTSSPVSHPAYTRLAQIEFFPYYRDSEKFGTEEIPKLEMLVDPELYEHFDSRFKSERGAGGIGSTG